MSEYSLKLEKREVTGKKAQALRVKGFIPSVIYGGKQPLLAASEYVATDKVVRAASYHSPITLNYDGKNKLAMLKTVHVDPVSHKIMNLEFAEISAREAVEADTPIVVEGFAESEASKVARLAFTQVLDEIAIKAKPADLPKELVVNAAGLTSLEDKLQVKDIVLPAGVEFANKEIDLEQAIIALYDPAAEAAAREAEEAAAAEEAATETPAEEAPAEEAKEEAKEA